MASPVLDKKPAATGTGSTTSTKTPAETADSKISSFGGLVAAAAAHSAQEGATCPLETSERKPAPLNFPEKLFSLLEDPEEESIQWNKTGTRFGITASDFAKNVLNKHFQGSKFESFMRKLSRWGFQRSIDKSFPEGVLVYENSHFLRDQKRLLSQLKGTKSKAKAAVKSQGTLKNRSQETAPNAPQLQFNPAARASVSQGTRQVTMSAPQHAPFPALAHQAPANSGGNLFLSDTIARHQHEEGRLNALQRDLNISALGTAQVSQLNPLSPQLQASSDRELQHLLQLQRERQNVLAEAELRLSLLQRQQLSAGQLLLNRQMLQNELLASASGSLPSQLQAGGLGALFPGNHAQSFLGTNSAQGSIQQLLASSRAGFGSQVTQSLSQGLSDSLNQMMSQHSSPTNGSNAQGTDPEETDSFDRQPSRFQEQQWVEHFKELRAYREKHGNCLVPQHTFLESPKLARWVKRQRYQYKLLKDGKPSNITMARVKALDSLGFVWDSHSAVWQERMNELLEFKKIHSHCNVPTTYAENRKLAAWVKCQRRQYKLRQEGKASNMTPERINDLEKIGFEWLLRSYRSKTKS